jgi:hypothetical protein
MIRVILKPPEMWPEKVLFFLHESPYIFSAHALGIVMLKNEDNILPLQKDKYKVISFIGPMVKEHKANMGMVFVNFDCHLIG